MSNRHISRFKQTLHTLHRWQRSRPQRLYEWQILRFIRNAQERWRFLLLWTGTKIFRTRKHVLSQYTSASIFGSFCRKIFGQFILAVLLIIGLEVIEHYFLTSNGSVWRFALSLGVIHQLKTVLDHNGIFLGKMQLNEATYVSFLSTVAQIAGVFLGLYFTAISVVASTIYARVSGDVRSLVTQEKFGNVYIRLVAFLCATAVLLLTIHAFGFQIGILNLSLVTLLSMVAIISFINLSRRVFDFFNPAILVKFVVQDLKQNIRLSTPQGIQWQNPSLQANYQNEAEKLLITYQSIVHLAIHEEHPQSSVLVELAGQAIDLLVFYTNKKLYIPSDSSWFRRMYRHPSWLTTDNAHLTLALHTGTALQPEAIPDLFWFEVQIEEILVLLLQVLLKENDLRQSYEIIGRFPAILGALAERGNIEEALHIFHTLNPIVLAHARKEEFTGSSSVVAVEEFTFTLSLIENYGLALIDILLGFSRSLQNTTVEVFGSIVDHIKWEQAKSIYTTGLPRPVIKQFEYLRKGILFEKEVEGQIISPAWYRRQIAALGYIRYLNKTIEALKGELESTFSVQVDALLADKHYILAAQLIQSGLEACQKFQSHFLMMKEYAEQLTTLRLVSDIPWETIPWEEINTHIVDTRKRLVLALGQTLPAVANLPQELHLPDYFGLIYSVLAQEAYMSMAKGDIQLFQQIFPAVFSASFLAPERVQTELQDYDKTMGLIYSTEPIEDILELSVYAIIYSELDNKAYWTQAKKLWDQYFTHYSDPQARADFITKTIEFRQSWPTIFPRALERTKWKQDLEHRLRERGFLNKTYSRSYFSEESLKKQKRHRSALFRALLGARDDYQLYYDALDVFIAVYSNANSKLVQLKLSRKAASLARELQHEQTEDGKTGKES